MLESLFNKVAGLQLCSFIKRGLQHRCFPVTFVKILRTTFFINNSGGCFCINYQKHVTSLFLFYRFIISSSFTVRVFAEVKRYACHTLFLSERKCKCQQLYQIGSQILFKIFEPKFGSKIQKFFSNFQIFFELF